ncbi:MAG: hypothetical protein ACI3X7_08855 [Bacteroidaceae bacterium]
MEKKLYKAPMSTYMEVATENIISLSANGGESLKGVDVASDVTFESKETSDNVWDNIW